MSGIERPTSTIAIRSVGFTAVLDYGMGNLHSVRNAFEAVGADVKVTDRPEDLAKADRIVLPGVGGFSECMRTLKDSGAISALEVEVLEKSKPFLGICLGMQVLGSDSNEAGNHEGFGWLPFSVRHLDEAATQHLKVPHVGWNNISPVEGLHLFNGLGASPTFYFVHSYRPITSDRNLIAAECDYGVPFVAAIRYRNIFATQFHPEKSQHNGLTLLSNFVSWDPNRDA